MSDMPLETRSSGSAPCAWHTNFLDSIPLALLLVDCTGTIIRANETECQLLGYTRAELEGALLWEFVANEEIVASRERLKSFLDGLEFTSSYRRRFRTKDNEHMLCELTVRVLHDESGLDPKLLLLSADVTRQVAETCARGEFVRWIEASYRCLPVAAVILDTVGCIHLMNHAAEMLLGWSEMDAVGFLAEDLLSWRDFRTLDGSPSHYDFRQGLAGSWRGSTVVIVSSGDFQHLEICTNPVVDSNGIVLGIAVCFKPL